MTLQQTALVGAGGAMGAISRAWLAHLLKSPPWDILAINVLGSFLIGLVLGWQSEHLSPNVRLLLGTGFCGGFTTFSTFSHQTLDLMAKGKTGTAMASMLASLVLCLAGTWAGIQLVQR